MARVRKKYVAHVSKGRVAKAALNDLAIGFCANNDHLRLINIKKKRFEHSGHAINAALEKVRYDWTIYIAAMGRTELGKAYIKSEVIRVPYDVFKHEINDVVAAQHERLRDEVPKKQLSNVGWLALPVHIDLSEKELGFYFDMLGCWDLLAPWQSELLGED